LGFNITANIIIIDTHILDFNRDTKSEIEKKKDQRNNMQELLRDGKLTIDEYRELKNPIDADISYWRES